MARAVTPTPIRARRALVVGRFQPPHNGHLYVLREAAAHADELVIAVGSAQRSHTAENPFTAAERVELLAQTCRDADIRVAHIVPVPDLDQYHLWVAQVRAYAPAFDLVVTGSAMTEQLFAAAGFRIHRLEVQDRARLSGTLLRQRLLGGEKIDDAVPMAVARFVATKEIRARLDALRTAAEGRRG